MKKFFKNLTEIKKYISQIRQYSCPHCHKSAYLVAHSFVYKKTYSSKRMTVGQRVFCSNRNNSNGCGRTFQLYINDYLPLMHYSSSLVSQFFYQLASGQSIENSYFQTTNCLSPRNAYRWINRFKGRLHRLKTYLLSQNSFIFSQHNKKYTAHYRQVISQLFFILDKDFIQTYQLLTQYQFF